MVSSFKRAYKACNRCRKNKSKCDLDPNAITCTKCLREQKECIFPAERSTKRVKLVTHSDNTDEKGSSKEPEVFLSSTNDVNIDVVSNIENSFSNLTQSLGHDEAKARHWRPSKGAEDQPIIPARSSNFQSQDSGWLPVATDEPLQTSEGEKQDAYTSSSLGRQVLNTVLTNSRDAIDLLFRAADQRDSDSSDRHADSDAELQDEASESIFSMPSPALASQETLSLWAQHRFVRQRWFTSYEAISYVEFFFQNISPLSPVTDTYYADHKNHKRLILEEPLLCCTILMIASRYHVPTRHGCRARSDFVHNRLWRHIEHLIQRITFGAEKYSLAKTRTLGSIQALLMIIEWHPRALHFPPEHDGWDASLAPTLDDDYHQTDSESQASKRWREDVFEPAKRSDRMSWMLVGVATTLAHELGVFDHERVSADEKKTAMSRVRRLLFVYINQLSLRLGCTTMFPYSSQQDVTHTPSTRTDDQGTDDRELLVSKWIEITKLMTMASDMLFTSTSTTQLIIKSSRYISILDHFKPLLRGWYSDFQSLERSTISNAARLVLLVEYHFVRMYINSIAVQAFVERLSDNSMNRSWLEHDLLRSESSTDYAYVKEVRDASADILQIATQLSEMSILQYCPVRFFLRVVAASIYLLKTVSLGSKETDVTKSLSQLERCISALQLSQADDIHLSGRYATLISRHVRHFKRNLKVRKLPGGDTQNGGMLVNHQSTSQQAQRQPKPDALSVDAMAGATVGGADDAAELNFSTTMEDWLAQPFETQFALFSTEGSMPASGLAVDSLDFLWNMGT